ncbi:hypothetical protein MNBD_UNCLBAC01-2047 [hydrothermal vent metagenome]|uniref:DUF1493 family protein n=1 Tax=hydrothermal vent metagenome TaxID=652676 RepID=A0A3B1DHT0_9ZZZZ
MRLNLIAVIRQHQGISEKKQISEYTLLEKNLGITGDDGEELLEEIEKQFLVSFIGKDGTLRDSFELDKNQYIFHSEGFNLFEYFLSLFGKESEKVESITVGQLYEAVLRATRT